MSHWWYKKTKEQTCCPECHQMEKLFVFQGDPGSEGHLLHCVNCRLALQRKNDPQLGDERLVYTYTIPCPTCGYESATFQVIISNIDNKLGDITCQACALRAISIEA